MGQLLAGSIMALARVALRDPLPGIIWTDADLLAFVGQAERAACLLRPDLFTVRAPLALVAGSLQSVPASATALIRLDENVAGGARCRLVDSAMLDAALLTWPATTATATVLEYCTDLKDRRRFHVYPPNTGAGSVVAFYGALPPTLASATSPINLDDVYDVALKHFVLAEALAYYGPGQDMNKAGYYRTSFEKLLAGNAQALGGMLPKYGATPGAA